MTNLSSRENSVPGWVGFEWRSKEAVTRHYIGPLFIALAKIGRRSVITASTVRSPSIQQFTTNDSKKPLINACHVTRPVPPTSRQPRELQSSHRSWTKTLRINHARVWGVSVPAGPVWLRLWLCTRSLHRATPQRPLHLSRINHARAWGKCTGRTRTTEIMTLHPVITPSDTTKTITLKQD